MPIEPLFPFGHGLSYSRFGLSKPRINKKDFKRGDELTIEVDVINEGAAAGRKQFSFLRETLWRA